MAQIIKHRRGSIDAVKGSTARKGELIMATGSVDTTLQGPFLFIGSDDGTGLYSPASKLYAGTSAPNIAAATYGSSLDGTPFYATSEKSLYILQNSNVGNTKIDLSGNLEGNTVSGMTINYLTGTTATFDTINLSTISFTGLTEGRVTLVGPGGSLVDSGSLNFNNGELGISGSIKLNTDAYIYNDGSLYVEDHTNGVYVQSNNFAELLSNNNYYYAEADYNEMYSSNETYIVSDSYMDIYVNSGNLWVSSYDNGILHLNNDSGEGDVHVLNGGGNALYVYGDVNQTSGKTINTDRLVGVSNSYNIVDLNEIVAGNLGLFSNNNVNVSGSNIYISGSSTSTIGQLDNSAYFYTDSNYAEMYGGSGLDVYTNGGNLWVYNNHGNVNISSYDGSTLYLNTDGGEGDVNLGNNSNSVWGYTNTTNFDASNYAQLGSNNSYLWVDSEGAYVQNDFSTVVGFTARPNGTIEATGSLFIGGDVNIDGDTSLTGALVVSNGSATFDQGLVAQNSNMLLTSGSNLIVQNNGYVATDYIQGNTQQWNYLALNGGALGAPNVELSSTGDISLFAEGGTVNVTGSLKVTGDIVFSGSINLGDFTGDTINFNGEVNSNILPSTGNTYSLGSSGQTWSDVWAENAHFTNISLNTISFNGLTEGRAVFVGQNGSLVDFSGYTFDSGSGYLVAPIVHATDDGNGTNFLIGNDMWLGDVNEANTTRFMGVEDSAFAKIYLGNHNTNDFLQSNYSNVTLSANGPLHLESANNDVYLDSGDGSIYLNNNTGNNIHINGHTYFDDYQTLYINEIYGNFGDYLDIAADGNIWINSYNNQAYLEVNEGDAGVYVANNDTTELWSYTNDVNIQSYNNNTYLRGNNTYIESTNGTLYLNNDSNNNIQVDGDTYFNTSRTMYVSNMVDNNDGTNYLQLYGSNTNDGYWWEGGNGRDTTLYADETANINIINRSGKVNIDSTDTLSIHTNNGVQITGSLVVSDASGVFNASLIVNNSDLTLDGGSNQHMNDGAHLYFDTCTDMYLDGSNNFVFYNDCNDFIFQNDIVIENYNTLYTNYIYGANNGDSLQISNDSDIWINSYNSYVELSYNEGDSYIGVSSDGAYMDTYVGDTYIQTYNDGTTYVRSYGGGGSTRIDSDNYTSIGYNNEQSYTYYESAGIYTYSDSGYAETSTWNDEDGTNYLWVENTGVGLQTYDYTSGLDHTVFLDNTGSLRLTNVSLGITGSVNIDGDLTVKQTTNLLGDVYVSGNFSVLGTGSVIHLSSSQVDIGTNIINLNTYAPFERFAGISVYDSGSNAGVTGSILWDSTNNVWVYANPSGSNYASARFISGPQNTGSLGQETGLTNGHIPVATGDDHISDSPLTYINTTLALNTNKFTVDSTSGDTEILGNFTIHGVGATDNGDYSSYIVFKNSDDVLGFIDTNDTGNETDRLLGYNSSTGVLEFSSLIDGGTY
jgi:hypothetical protein